ncbi:MAG: helix-turn-helix domain-containing protein [Bacillota bacterium]
MESGTAAPAISGQTFNPVGRRITVKEIQDLVIGHYQLASDDMITDRRKRKITRPRQLAMWLARQFTNQSLPTIGRRFGGRDHTTVLHAIRRIDELCAEDSALAADREHLVRMLQ